MALYLEVAVKEAIDAMRAKRPGAERDVLLAITDHVWANEPIDPRFQRLANAILAQTLFKRRLPAEAKGRPADLTNIGLDVAHEYCMLRDNDMPYAEAVAAVAKRFSKSERHVMRLVAENKFQTGSTKLRRQESRARYRSSQAEFERQRLAAGIDSKELSDAEARQEVELKIKAFVRTCLDAADKD